MACHVSIQDNGDVTVWIADFANAGPYEIAQQYESNCI